MKFQTIQDCLHSFIDGYSTNEGLIDAVNANRESKQALEKLLDEQLWIPEDYVFPDAASEAYYIQLSQIEDRLVANSLIYND